MSINCPDTVKIMIVATKSPWPPRDGGRLALWLTMQGLAAAGHELALVAPVATAAEASNEVTLSTLRRICTPQLVIAAKPSWLVALTGALRDRVALTVARHRSWPVTQALAQAIDRLRPDVIHVEQLQALANCAHANTRGIPLVLRMQNIESALWQQVASARLRARPLKIEAKRLRRDETRALHRATSVIALTHHDAEALRVRVDDTQRLRIVAIAPPFPNELVAASAVDGAPAVVLAGSAGWWPNQQGLIWFTDSVMPLLLSMQPTARAHSYGGARIDRAGVTCHPAPVDARDAFPVGAIAAIPLHIGSGIRMRILEAFARGLPVVATTAAARGLHVRSEHELLIADTPAAFALAIKRLSEDSMLSAHLIAAGRAYLAEHHDSQRLTRTLVATYQSAIDALSEPL